DGKTLVTVSPRYLRLWDTTTWQKQRDLDAKAQEAHPAVPLRLGQDFCPAMVIAPDGQSLAVVAREHSSEVFGGYVIRLWHLPTGQERFAAGATQYRIDALAFSADSRTLVAGSGGTLRFWDVATGQERA